MIEKTIPMPAAPIEPFSSVKEPLFPAASSVKEPLFPDVPKTTPGYQTTEFWTTLVATIIPNLITVLAIIKVVPNEIASTLSTSLVAVIGGIITIFVALRYVKSRTEVKVKSMELLNSTRSYILGDAHAKAELSYKTRSSMLVDALAKEQLSYQKENDKKQLILSLLDKGVVDKEMARKELNI